MIELLAPSLTKNVPMIEVTMQAPQIAERIEHRRTRERGWPAKKIAASTIVATTVTA